MGKVKIGILTYHAAHNYGSMLQAWALLQFLNKNGLDAEDINLRNEKQKKLYKRPYISDSLKSLIRNLFFLKTTVQLNKKWNKFELFLKTHLRISKKEFSNWDEINGDLETLKYKAIIVGGDQCWNFLDTDYDESYVLPENIQGIKKYSYAPSMGMNAMKFSTDEWLMYIKKTIGKFDVVSTRDEDCSLVLSKALQREIDVVIDPAMLLEPYDYDKIMKAPDKFPSKVMNGGYIFYYTPWYDPEAENIALLVSKHYNLPVVTSTPQYKCCPKNCFLKVLDAGPQEFLWLIKNASVVCGKSFHLLVFAILFHKDFWVIDGLKDSRMKTLLNKCNLIDRSISSKSNELKIPAQINFMEVDYIIKEFKVSSQKFLLDTLSNL